MKRNDTIIIIQRNFNDTDNNKILKLEFSKIKYLNIYIISDYFETGKNCLESKTKKINPPD